MARERAAARLPIARLPMALLLVALLACVACGGSEEGGSQSYEATARAAVRNGATLLDVRTRAEFASSHVRGALNIPLAELRAHMGELEGERLVVYSASGPGSAEATTLLEAEGWRVMDIGPMSRWPSSAEIVNGQPIPPG